MDNKHNPHGGGNGFILGVIVGVVITLLFTTNRGRKVLRVLTEKGFERFSDLQQAFDEEEEVGGDDYVEPESQNSVAHPEQAEQSPRQIPASSNSPSAGKRFFRKKS